MVMGVKTVARKSIWGKLANCVCVYMHVPLSTLLQGHLYCHGYSKLNLVQVLGGGGGGGGGKLVTVSLVQVLGGRAPPSPSSLRP